MADSHDKAPLDYIHFGFPLGIFPDHDIKCNAEDNHSSAREFSSAVEEYLQTELKEGALLGPFNSPHMINLHGHPL